ncbi:MAG: NAD kinase [Flavobacteriaceae bacterium]|nr:NAD kinase [Bacteroidia bacterium]NNF75689.1 NAD kinase [Flavobacteriaceae bacterium]NNK74319.1 NAD kinase [Flavobacteriaceae bacterium]
MRIAIYGQFYPKNSERPVQLLFDSLKKRRVDVFIEQHFFEAIQKEHDVVLDSSFKVFEHLDKSFDLLISIGGDGTILRSAAYVHDLNIPIVGINTGRLGFLATIQKENLELALDDIFNGKYKISERSAITISTDPDTGDFDSLNFALNEIAVSRKNTTSMITVETFLNGEYLTSYWADGLIISTPTGSTGYSLSCGGPVIMPEADNFVITPIAPHNLNARPLIIPDSTKIQLRVSGREDHFLVSLDSRLASLHNDTIIHIKKAAFNIKMLELKHESFLETLRKKLLWGEDKRN